MSSSSNRPTNVPAEPPTNRKCARCEQERRRGDAILLDLENTQADVIAKNRQIGRLKAEIAAQREEEPLGSEVKHLLVYARDQLGKTSRWYIGLDGDRAKLARKVKARYGDDRCKKAVNGLAAKPFAGPRGRSAIQYPGAKRHDELEHCWGTDERFTKCEEIAEELERPTLDTLADVQEPEAMPRAFVRHVYGDECKLPRIPASEHRPRQRRSSYSPVDEVLNALHARGCEWRAGKPDSWSAQCPAHDDRAPSLAIHRAPDGKVLLNCFAGCDTGDVLHALDLEWRDLWEHSEDDFQASGYRDPAERQRTLPPHLRQAMQQLIARDERQAAA